MYFMYLGAVVGSRGLINSDATASLINRDTVPAAESFNPNRSLSELFVSCSPHCKPEVQEDNELNGDYDFYRPIIRLENYD